MKFNRYKDIRTGFYITFGDKSKKPFDGFLSLGSCTVSLGTYGTFKPFKYYLFEWYGCYKLEIEIRNNKLHKGKNYWINLYLSENGLINRFKKTPLYLWFYWRFLWP